MKVLSCTCALALWLCGLAPVGAQSLVVALCTAGQNSPAGTAVGNWYVQDGAALSLWLLAEAEAAMACEQLELPLAEAEVRWLAPAPLFANDPPARLALQGYFEASGVRISEVITGQGGGQPSQLLPFGENLLGYFEQQPFGVEERVQQADDAAFVCEAGSLPAGLVLRSSSVWESPAGVELELLVAGEGEFQLAIADRSREEREAPLVLGTLVLRADERARVFRYRLPGNSENWRSLSLLCPPARGSIELQAMRLLPQQLPVPRTLSAWLWSPALWREQADRLWQLVEREGLDQLYLSVPVTSAGQVADAALLAAFVAEASQRGIAVWAVAGDPRDVLQESRPALLARAQAYLDYNQSVPPEAALAGLQLDIEPYLLPGFALDHVHWRERYLDTIGTVHALLDRRLSLDLVLPVWWGTHPDWSEHLLDALPREALSLSIMNYRTDLARLREGALPFLAWGQRSGVAVSMALETGSIGPDENRRDYLPVEDEGELWLLELAGQSLLLLLDTPSAGLPGQAFRQVGEGTAPAGAITFGGDQQRLRDVMTVLEVEWSAWSSFSGIDLHGLEELYATTWE